MNKKTISAVIIVIISFIGLLLHIHILTNSFTPTIFWYFTVQSNLIVLVYYFIILKSRNTHTNKNRNIYRLKGCVLLPILLTGTLNWFILVPEVIKHHLSLLILMHPSNVLVHGLVPLLVLLDFLFFTDTNVFKWYDPFLWTLYPLIYMLTIFVRGTIGAPIFDDSYFPYPFFDITVMGSYSNVFLIILLISFIYLLVGFAIYRFNQR